MQKWVLKLDKYGISDGRYKEMEGFCTQYREWKQFLQNNTDPIFFVMRNDEIPTVWDEDKKQMKRKAGYAYLDSKESASNRHSNVSETSATEKLAIERAIRSAKIDIVETCAKQAGQDLWPYIITGICNGANWTWLEQHEKIPCSRSAYYRIRRLFFIILDKVMDSAGKAQQGV